MNGGGGAWCWSGPIAPQTNEKAIAAETLNSPVSISMRVTDFRTPDQADIKAADAEPTGSERLLGGPPESGHLLFSTSRIGLQQKPDSPEHQENQPLGDVWEAGGEEGIRTLEALPDLHP